MATTHAADNASEATPRTQADVQRLATRLLHGEITQEAYFAAVDRRAERLVAAESER